MAAFCAALLVSAHLLFWRGRSLHGLRCSAAAALSGSLDKSLLDSIHTLRYDEAVLEAERDRLLGIGFSQARSMPGSGSAAVAPHPWLARSSCFRSSLKAVICLCKHVTAGIQCGRDVPQVPFNASAVSADGAGLPQLFLYMAVFSTTDFRARRDAVRAAWMVRHRKILAWYRTGIIAAISVQVSHR